MKNVIKMIFAAAVITCSLQVSAQTQEEGMKKWMEFMTPSEMHAMLAGMDGEWNEEISFWMAPGAPPQNMQSSCTNKMVLGGRYQEGKHTGTFDGMPFEGIGTLAWDNGRKVFVNTWIDNMGTGIMILEGTWDAASKTIHLLGTTTDPMTGKAMKVREELKIIDDNTQELTQYNVYDGKEFKSMFIRATRKR